MLTRRKIRRLHSLAEQWFTNGQHWESGHTGCLDPAAESVHLPGVEEYERDTFLRHRPGLRAAYDALNSAAEAYAEKRGVDLGYEFSAKRKVKAA